MFRKDGDVRLEGTRSRSIWLLLWPLLILNTFPVVVDFFEIKIISSLDTSSLAALYTANTFVYLFTCVTGAFWLASTAIISRSFGAGDLKETVSSTRSLFSTSFFSSILLCGMFLFFVPYFASLLLPASDKLSQHYFITYMQRASLGLPALFIMNVLMGALVAINNTKLPMLISCFQVSMQLVISYYFIPSKNYVIINDFIVNGLELGIGGAGYAKSISQWIAMFILLWQVSVKYFPLIWKLAIPRLEEVYKIYRIAVPAMLTSLVNISMYLVFNKILTFSSNATDVLAASRAGIAIESFTTIPICALSTVSSVLVGQSLGNNKKAEASAVGWKCAHYAGMVTGMISICILLYPEYILKHLLTENPGIIPLAVEYLQYICITIPIYAYGTILLAGIQGAGDTKIPLWITIIDMWCLRIPLAWYLVVWSGWGFKGAWAIMSATQGLFGILGMFAFKYLNWSKYKI